MKEILQDIFDCAELEMSWRFIDFETKLMTAELKQVDENPFLTHAEKHKLTAETISKYYIL